MLCSRFHCQKGLDWNCFRAKSFSLSDHAPVTFALVARHALGMSEYTATEYTASQDILLMELPTETVKSRISNERFFFAFIR